MDKIPLCKIKVIKKDIKTIFMNHVSDHFKTAHIQEHVLPLHDLTMLNSAVSSVQHQITLR
jgi:hypothetical protein